MKKMWITLVLLIFLLPDSILAETPIKAAFIRDQGLWLYKDDGEVLLQENISISNLSWSFDGQWLAFETTVTEANGESDIWLYHVPSNKHTKLKMKGNSIMWSPTGPTFAFLSDSILSVVELSSMNPVIHQLTGGVSHFSWDTEGKNLIASASAMLFPDGWSHPRLYVVNWMLEKKKQELDVKVDPLYTISSPLNLDDLSIISIEAEKFNWSKDGKLLAFIVSPTASWSADSNMLSVFVNENKILIPLGEILRKKEWIKWAPTKPLLASIQGGGRLTTGVKNKKLTVQSILPNQKKVFTPVGCADIDFDWIDDNTIVVARGLEADKPAPFYSSLYIVNTKDGTSSEKRLVKTPDGSSDENPIFLKNRNLISWIRKDSNGWNTVWISKTDGSEQQKLIDGVERVVWFTE
ncbi:PD40 domain-containing protein [Sutcliffiella halmapala]|uniref:PD40 domain-containing protein n=1 Tax=Sutcliffiella halmapala TaxID=79882 RepID=UPI000994A92B|nr:PD40 domain-containing protein [Sutcliffiella halmapala]